MKVTIPVMIQDPGLPGKYKIENVSFDNSMFTCFLDGPVTDRLAVLDFDPKTGELVPGVRFEPPARGRKKGRYHTGDENSTQSPGFCQRNIFGLVADTLRMFEEEDVLGRKVKWAFNSPQLLVVPRAGEWANALYQRDSHSLQFFFFNSINNPRKTVYTCLSRDIAAHETGHAVFDGICPELYNAITPQSLALHEAVADLTAMLMAFRSRKLGEMVLRQTNGSIENSSFFSSFAEEFGNEYWPGNPGFLRNLKNHLTMDASFSHTDPYKLCLVLTGAVYTVAEKIFKLQKKILIEKNESSSEFSVSGFALYKTHELLSRMLFRALDYLPPGEVTFADYGRAIIAADKSLHPDNPTERNWLADEFVKRHMVEEPGELNVNVNFQQDAVLDFDLESLVSSDWAAYTFAANNRTLLGIPEDVPFEVHPRIEVKRKYFPSSTPAYSRECLFKVSWQYREANGPGTSLEGIRRFTVGTTLVIDWDATKKLQASGNKQIKIKTLLTSDPSQSAGDRDLLIERLIERGLLKFPDDDEGLDGISSQWVARAEIAEGILRIRKTGAALHLLGEK